MFNNVGTRLIASQFNLEDAMLIQPGLLCANRYEFANLLDVFVLTGNSEGVFVAHKSKRSEISVYRTANF
jgi:hypothetical protein